MKLSFVVCALAVAGAVEAQSASREALAFGAGRVSEFVISSSERAVVVGVSGLGWDNFKSRAYKGQGYTDADKKNQSFMCFDDSRLMDIEKTSDKGTDYNYCYFYADIQAMMFGGYVSGYTDEDSVAAYIRGLANPGDYTAITSGAPIPKWLNPFDNASTFLSDLAGIFSTGGIRCAMDVCIDHASGDRDSAYHSVSLVGYSYDTSKGLSDPTAIKGLFVIDSDNDMYNGAGGSSAPDSITYCPVTYGEYGTGASKANLFIINNVFGTYGYVDSVWYYDPKNAVETHKTVVEDYSTDGSSSGTSTVDVPVVTPTGAFEAAKATTLSGVVIENGAAAGVVQLKVGKASKKGESSVSVTVTDLAGKKYTSKSVKVETGATAAVELVIKKLGTMTLTIGANGFAGTLNGATVTSVDGTDATTAGTATFTATDLSSVANALTEYLPANEAVTRTAKKWSVVNKAGKLKYVKPNAKKGIAGGLEATGSNIAGLKLTYTAKTQTFKGSFKIWTFDSAKNKLKSVSATVTGVVVNGTGYGQVKVKKSQIGTFRVE